MKYGLPYAREYREEIDPLSPPYQHYGDVVPDSPAQVPPTPAPGSPASVTGPEPQQTFFDDIPLPSAEDRAIREAKDARMRAALINLAATFGGGPAAYNPSLADNAYKSRMDEYHMRQAAEQRKQQELARQQQTERQRKLDALKVLAGQRDEKRLGIAEQKAEREEQQYRSGLEERQARRDQNSELNVAARERFAEMWPNEWAMLPEHVRNGLTVEDMKSPEFQEFYQRGEKRYRAGLAGGIRMRQPVDAPYRAPTSPEQITTPDDATVASLMERANVTGTVPPRIEAVLAQIPQARGKTRQQLLAQADKMVKDYRDEVKDGAQKYGEKLVQHRIPDAIRAIRNLENAIADARAAGYTDDLPGVGWQRAVSETLLGERLGRRVVGEHGRKIQRAIKDFLDAKLRIRTGAQAPEGEFRSMAAIVGADAWDTDADMLDGISKAYRAVRETDEALRRGYGEDAITYYYQQSGSWLDPSQTGMNVRNPKKDPAETIPGFKPL